MSLERANSERELCRKGDPDARRDQSWGIGLAEVPAGRHGDAWEAAAEWWRSQLDCSGSRGPGVKKEREPGARR